MKRRADRRREEFEKDEFQAYGEYTYDYLHKVGEPSESEAQTAPREKAAHAKKRVRARKKRGWLVFLFLLVVATIALIVIMETIFRIQAVYVIGNKAKTPQEIVTLSGLKRGESIFSIREEDIKSALTSDHTIIYKGMKKDYPSTIYLYIDEREAVAMMQWLGMQYMLDENGLVMSEHSNMELPAGMPLVTGFRVSNANAGQPLMVRSDQQLEAYHAIMEELRLQVYTAQITEINLSDPHKLYLITQEGVTAYLGDASYMQAKIGALRTYMAYLRQLGKKSGTLDVSVPEDAKYMPES